MGVHIHQRCFSVRLVIRGQLLNVLRNCTTQAKSTRKWKNSLHVYSYSFNWGSLNELSHVLARDVIVNRDGLVVINKPCGIAKEKPIVKHSKLGVQDRLRTTVLGEKGVYLDELLPLLARKLGYKHLETVKIPERYTSGVTILSSSEELSLHVKNCIKKGKDQGKFLDTYWLVCVGTPDPHFLKTKVAIQHEEDKVSGGTQPVILRSWSNNAAKRGDVVTVSVEHSTKCQGEFGSLVEVKPSRTKSHFLRFYMSYMMSPVLGDNLYGSRVQKIGEVPVVISPFSDRAKMPKRLEDSLLSRLNLQRGDELFIPVHMHLRRVTIPHFHGKEQSLDIEAPVPEYFEWTCKQLLGKEVVKEDNAEVQC